MKVVFLCQADYAGSAFQTVSAINSVGRIEARQIVCHKHPFGFDADIILPSVGTNQSVEECEGYEEACQLLEDADLIHCWNDEYHDYWGRASSPTKAFTGTFPIYHKKYKSVAFTGTWYRHHHKVINARLKGNRTACVTNHPMMRFIAEYDQIQFIPSAIDVTEYIQWPISTKTKIIGCYKIPGGKTHPSNPNYDDVFKFEECLKKGFPEWKLTMGEFTGHAERMAAMTKNKFYFEYMDPKISYWGRSVIEAAAMGIPFFVYMSAQSLELSQGRIGDPPHIQISEGTMQEVMHKTLHMSDDAYTALANRTRKWAEAHYSYTAVGELYTKFFEKLQ